MGEGRGREISGASVRREGEDMQGREMGMHEKNSLKTQHTWHLGKAGTFLSASLYFSKRGAY